MTNLQEIKKMKETPQQFSLRMREAQKAKKRVLIAEDVLKWIDAGNITPVKGIYVGTAVRDLLPEAGEVELSSLLKQNREKTKGCLVCALGALFLTTVDRFNECKVNRYSGFAPNGKIPTALDKSLHRYFSVEQLTLIESAFEKAPMGMWSHEKVERAIKFGALYYDTSARLKAIMNNIIENKGTFIP